MKNPGKPRCLGPPMNRIEFWWATNLNSPSCEDMEAKLHKHNQKQVDWINPREHYPHTLDIVPKWHNFIGPSLDPPAL